MLPKEVFVCQKKMKFGAYNAVIQFNDGSLGCLDVFTKLNIMNPGYFTLKSFKHLDDVRICDSKRHSLSDSKKRRKILRAVRKKKN